MKSGTFSREETMAGDWIKMRSNLWDDPRVTSIVDATDSTEATVIGALYWLWSMADQHSEDGFLHGISLRQIDRKTGVAGFAAAVVAVGWMEDLGNGVEIVRFNEHNGASAKRRASESRRKMSARNADKARTDNGSFAHLEREKEKDIKNPLSSAHEPEANLPPHGTDSGVGTIKTAHDEDWQPDLDRLAVVFLRAGQDPPTNLSAVLVGFNLHYAGRYLTENQRYQKILSWTQREKTHENRSGNTTSTGKPKGFEYGDAVGQRWLEQERERERAAGNGDCAIGGFD